MISILMIVTLLIVTLIWSF
ncbi:hypothetical protein Golax_010300 [Gossypium laxum]|uniref:Uncharacterized protein n=1 Tax=Gossypium laxum TaxID=34288 RepID=A0A7J8ZH22_9ROSI|nr:hypothetical protein [Gossypium laxum]